MLRSHPLHLLHRHAYAATANTVRGAYGLQLSQDVRPLKEELLRVQRTIHTVTEISIYNEIIASTSTEQIDERIFLLTKDADALRGQVLTGIDMPLEDILRCEAEYAAVVQELDMLLSVRDYYSPDKLPTPDEDLLELRKTENALQTSIEEAGYYEDIGKMDYYPVIGQTYRVNSGFGTRYDPLGSGTYTYHRGVDLWAPEGTQVGAWFSGTVISTGYSVGSGNYIWLDHGYGVRSFYCHLKRIDVSTGDNVMQSTQIALSGNTGENTTGAHLHLALYIDGTPVDPRVLLE